MQIHSRNVAAATFNSNSSCSMYHLLHGGHHRGMDTKALRRDNIEILIAERFEGNKAAFGRAIGREATQVYQWRTGLRGLGEEAARDIEQRLGLTKGWLDTPQGDYAEQPFDPELHDAEREEALADHLSGHKIRPTEILLTSFTKWLASAEQQGLISEQTLGLIEASAIGIIEAQTGKKAARPQLGTLARLMLETSRANLVSSRDFYPAAAEPKTASEANVAAANKALTELKSVPSGESEGEEMDPGAFNRRGRKK